MSEIVELIKARTGCRSVIVMVADEDRQDISSQLHINGPGNVHLAFAFSMKQLAENILKDAVKHLIGDLFGGEGKQPEAEQPTIH